MRIDLGYAFPILVGYSQKVTLSKELKSDGSSTVVYYTSDPGDPAIPSELPGLESDRLDHKFNTAKYGTTGTKKNNLTEAENVLEDDADDLAGVLKIKVKRT